MPPPRSCSTLPHSRSCHADIAAGARGCCNTQPRATHLRPLPALQLLTPWLSDLPVTFDPLPFFRRHSLRSLSSRVSGQAPQSLRTRSLASSAKLPSCPNFVPLHPLASHHCSQAPTAAFPAALPHFVRCTVLRAAGCRSLACGTCAASMQLSSHPLEMELRDGQAPLPKPATTTFAQPTIKFGFNFFSQSCVRLRFSIE